MWRRWAAVVASLPLIARPIHAQEAPADRGGASESLLRRENTAPKVSPTPALTITPPKLLVDPGVSYPAAALAEGHFESTAVALKIDVDAEGRVTKVVVETPRGHGFDEAAIAAAGELRYEPAKKGERAIASRWRHVYTFEVPRANLDGRVRTSTTDRALPGATVRLEREGEAPLLTTTDGDGRFDFGAQPRGPVRVVASAAGYAELGAEDTLVPAQVTTLTLRLERQATQAPSADAAGPRFEEVTVRGQRPPREVTKRTLERRELERVPGTNGDALRAIQSLPGVARPPGLAGLLIVRGAAPNATNVFVDGTLIPLAYHFGGLSSVIPTELIDRIDFYPGNFSTRYGRVTGGIIDVGLRAPRTDRISGMAQVDLIDARGVADGPIGGPDSNWSFALGARRSYVDLWLKPVLEAAGAGVSTAPVYYDWQAVLERRLPDRGRLNLAFYGSDDRLEVLVKSVNGSDPALGGGLGMHTAFWRLAATYKQSLGPKTELSMVTAFGKSTVELNFGDNVLQFEGYPLTSRVDVGHRLGAGTVLNVGIDTLSNPYDIFIRLPTPPRPGEPDAGPGLSREPRTVRQSATLYRPAAFAELELTPREGTRIVPGVRVDYTRDTGGWDVSPRVSARHELTSDFPKTALKGGAGLFVQPPQPQESNSVFGQTTVSSARAYGYALGFEQDLFRRVNASVEGFYRRTDNVIVQGLGNRGVGTAYGLEMLVRYKPDDHFFGWLAYTLSRSVQRDQPSEPERLTQFDQTHILTAIGSWRLGAGWELGGRFRLISGSNVTPNTYGFFDGNSAVNLPAQSYPPFGERLPLFHQLDIRLDRTWTWPTHRVDAYLDLQNAYNSPNSESISYNYNYTRRSYAGSLPILPSIGARIDF